ncbi:MAG: GntR family transcriptional regulator, partial [Spirochaetia bacterium]|nr:GntR family transcriptional regulator [Spirochaetia bacterium]
MHEAGRENHLMNRELRQNVLEKRKDIPLYKQLKAALMVWIQESENGTSLPTEEELCRQFGVSRQTVRQAVLELVDDGLVTRRPGQGSFVKKKKISRDTRWALEDFNREMRFHGLAPETIVLSLTIEKSLDFVSRQLNVAKQEEVVVIRRQRFVDGWPVVIQQSYLPARLFPDFASKQKDLETRSLHAIIEQDYHYLLQSAERTVEAIPAPSREAELLKIAPGSPVLYSTSVWKIDNEVCVEFVLEWYRGDRSQFNIQLGRKRE